MFFVLYNEMILLYNLIRHEHGKVGGIGMTASADLVEVAPLSESMARHLLSHQSKQHKPPMVLAATLEQELEEAKQRYQTEWSALHDKVRIYRPKVYTLLSPLIQPSGGQLSTDWILHALKEYTHRSVTPQTLSRWREHGLLRYHQKDQPDADSTAALLISGMIDDRARGWLPPAQAEDEPLWWCWRQDSPRASAIPCQFPLPDLPPSTLLWTPWTGAAWNVTWLNVGTFGAIRWAGTMRVGEKLLWQVTCRDLEQWVPEVISLGEGLDITPEITHTLANVALLHLARTRLGPLAFAKN